jgi:hypothetical protein
MDAYGGGRDDSAQGVVVDSLAKDLNFNVVKLS